MSEDPLVTVQGTQRPDNIPQGTKDSPWIPGAELLRSMDAAQVRNDIISRDESAIAGEMTDPMDTLQRTFEEIERRLDDPRRLHVVQEILDRPVPAEVDPLIRTLAADLDCAFAAVTIIDKSHQHFLSTNMGTMDSCERDSSKCQYVIGTGHMVAINNVGSSGLWRRVLQSLLPGSSGAMPLQAYLGVPLKEATTGAILGAVCVVDDKPRTWTAEEHFEVYSTSQAITVLLGRGTPEHALVGQ